MAVITPDTFDPLRDYVGVRLQQGVPIVDADWNELEDARRFDERVLKKWFIGDGVPAGNNGFSIQALTPGGANDFTISAGGQVGKPPDALEDAGRCLADGREAMIVANITFTGQPLHESNGTAAQQLAGQLGVPVIAALQAPSADGTVIAYLDVWDRLVTPTEDPSLVLPGLGTESCARKKREWVVRVDTAVPQPGGATFLTGHSYLALANIARHNGVAAVLQTDITDVRRTGLSLFDVLRRVAAIEPLLGISAPVTVGFAPRMLPATPGDIGTDAWAVVWGDASNGTYATIDGGLQKASGVLPISLPEGVKLRNLTVLGDAPNAGSMTTILIQELRTSPYTQTPLVSVTGFASAVIPNSPVFNSGQYVYYLTATIPQDPSMVDPHLRGFTITYSRT